MTITDIIYLMYNVTSPLAPFIVVTFGVALSFSVLRNVIDLVHSGLH